MGAELFHAYGRTDLQTGMITLIVAFRNFANVPKKKLKPMEYVFDTTNNASVKKKKCVFNCSPHSFPSFLNQTTIPAATSAATVTSPQLHCVALSQLVAL